MVFVVGSANLIHDPSDPEIGFGRGFRGRKVKLEQPTAHRRVAPIARRAILVGLNVQAKSSHWRQEIREQLVSLAAK